MENGPFVLILNSLWSRFSNRNREDKGPHPLGPGPIAGTKAPTQGKKLLDNPRIEPKMSPFASSFLVNPPTEQI